MQVTKRATRIQRSAWIRERDAAREPSSGPRVADLHDRLLCCTYHGMSPTPPRGSRSMKRAYPVISSGAFPPQSVTIL